MKVYKYLPISFGSQAILIDATLKFSSHKDFNDPFDCIVSYNTEASLSYLKSRKDLFLKASEHLKLSPSRRIENKNKMYKGIENSITSGDFHKDIIDRIGICCFSKKPDNILMWSHYAHNHTGFVIEFDIDLNDPTLNLYNSESNLIGYDIVYKDEMPIIKVGKGGFDAVKDVFLTKSNDWSYEEEYRVLTRNKGPGIHDFNLNKINKIIFGVKTSGKDIERLTQIVNDLSQKLKKDIPIIQAKMVEGKYKLKVD